jgi:hypothetical protein
VRYKAPNSPEPFFPKTPSNHNSFLDEGNNVLKKYLKKNKNFGENNKNSFLKSFSPDVQSTTLI